MTRDEFITKHPHPPKTWREFAVWMQCLEISDPMLFSKPATTKTNYHGGKKMARFKATIQGSRGQASRLGGVESGISVEANGWNLGIYVMGYVDDDGNDRFQVYRTDGSNGVTRRKITEIHKYDGAWVVEQLESD